MQRAMTDIQALNAPVKDAMEKMRLQKKQNELLFKYMKLLKQCK